LRLHAGLLAMVPPAAGAWRKEGGRKWWALVCVLARLSARQRLR
jgi:hypothetical protein